ncbi:Protein kinase C-binding protein NELL1 [Atta colombica]|uniref:Protein kinase C-binding protein NELL1 n=1 Tax=Atta colombica TaxID=520822 RepID=A0A195BGI8_9HYME|nr:Protein kinase C-binding protein NELL1 [Atta colombica]
MAVLICLMDSYSDKQQPFGRDVLIEYALNMITKYIYDRFAHHVQPSCRTDHCVLLLSGEERELRLNEENFERAAALLRRVPEFTIAAALRQEEANSGTIVAFAHGNNRYLELQSSGRKDELRLHYVSRRDGTVHVEAFPFRLADGAWHRVALSISGSQVELLVDCHPLYRRLLRPGPPDTNFTLPQLQLWVGQRNVRHFLFKGALQDVKLIAGPHGYLSQCPQLDSSCPTCGQFSILQNTVEQLMHNLNELTRRLAAAEGRISKVEECECQKSCRVNGTIHDDGESWSKGCQHCSCLHGEVECKPTFCTPVTCKNPIIPEGQCCPICLRQCYLHGVIYDHGERVSPKQCVECNCYDGSFTCTRIDTDTKCPPLPCPPSEQLSVAEECCKFCPGVDYCAKGHKCHTNASCLNLQTTYACHCDIGFQGDGLNCHDVDECKQQGGSNGHYCNANTKCVNVIGSYTCECLPGYYRMDKFNCAELDECATGQHLCDEHATCVNTNGSYYCICKDGYTGDAMCNQTCQNGGECVTPGRCSCRRGYIGNSCELDLDECASDLHRCHQSSTCFNMPGWYYCRCKPGYRSALHESTQGTQCVDIDECNDLTIERRHTCHPTAKCVNTEGGYECVCPPTKDLEESGKECRLSCWFENREVTNGDTLAPSGNPCRRCTCQDGVITCKDPICDCSAPGSHRDKCCPQCNPAASCRHQELHHLVFRSGERWIYQCQTCECLYGEIDCWQMECPPVTCSNPVTEEGDCCPRCEDDPCAREVLVNGTSFTVPSRPRPCSYAGIIHDSGSSWQDPHDKCTTCECKTFQSRIDKPMSIIMNKKFSPPWLTQSPTNLFDHIVNPIKSIIWYLKKIDFRDEAFAIVSSVSRENFREAGIRLTEQPNVSETDPSATIKEVLDRSSVKAVIVDFDINWNWSMLALAISCLEREDVLYIAGPTDEWFQIQALPQIKILGPGPLLNVISAQSGRQPISCAKPSQNLKDYILDKCNVTNLKRCLFIGDTINQDMKFASMCGFIKLLVGTGCDTLEQAQKEDDTYPDYYISSLGQLFSDLTIQNVNVSSITKIVDSSCPDREKINN